jgi:undecaprenyl pyrophosphate synthase
MSDTRELWKSFSSRFQKLLQHCWLMFCRFLLSRGPVATHVAFIMDGNRRFGKKFYNSSKMGHFIGSRRLLEVIKS